MDLNRTPTLPGWGVIFDFSDAGEHELGLRKDEAVESMASLRGRTRGRDASLAAGTKRCNQQVER